MASNQSKIPVTEQPPDESKTPSFSQTPEGTRKPVTDPGIVGKIVTDTGQTKIVEGHTIDPAVAKVAPNEMQDVVVAPQQGASQEVVHVETEKLTETPKPISVTDTNPPVLATDPGVPGSDSVIQIPVTDTQPVLAKDIELPIATKDMPVLATDSDTSISATETQQPATGIQPVPATESRTLPVLATNLDPSISATDIQLSVVVTDTKPSVLAKDIPPVLPTDIQQPVVATSTHEEVKMTSLPSSSPVTDITASNQTIPSATEDIKESVMDIDNSTDIITSQDTASKPQDIPLDRETTVHTLPISIPILHTDTSPNSSHSVEDKSGDKQLELPTPDVVLHTEEMITDKTECVKVPTHVIQEMEVTASGNVTASSSDIKPDSSSVDSKVVMLKEGEGGHSGQPIIPTDGEVMHVEVVEPVVEAKQYIPTDKQQGEVVMETKPSVPTDKQQQHSEVMHTEVAETVREDKPIIPTDKQQQSEVMHTEVVESVLAAKPRQEESAVMDISTELPQQFTSTLQNEKPTEVQSSEPVAPPDEPMSPVCDIKTMQIDPTKVLQPVDDVHTPTLLQNTPIDTIVIPDSPVSAVSQGDPMEVIDLTSDSSPVASAIHSSNTPPSKRSKVSLSSGVDLDSSPSPAKQTSKMFSDIHLLEQLINNCELLNKFSVQDQKICFSFLHKDVCIDYTLICLEEDYPQITLTVNSKLGEKSDILSKRIPYVAWDVLKDCCEKQHIPLPVIDSLPPQLADLIQTSQAPYHAQISTQSTASHTSNYSGDDEDIDPSDDDDYNEFDEIDEEVAMNALLDKDIDRVRQKYGKDALETRNYGGIGDIDIDLIVDMNFLEPEIARAWGVKHTIPLTFRLSLSAEHYLDGADIKVEVFQEDKGNTKGICKQLEKIVSQFISTSTKVIKNPLCNSKVEEAVEAYNTLEQRLAVKRKAISKSGGLIPEKKGLIAQFMDKFTKDKQVDCDMLIAQLVEMGWETELAVHALEECNMDLEKALNYLSEEKIIDESDLENPKTFDKQKSRGAEVSGLDWMSDISDTNEAALKSKMFPPLSHGFLCQVIHYILNRVPTLNDFCVICDETHLFANGAMLKPTVCARELCSFAFQTLGVMADVADSIATGPEVVELLVAMCNAASLSNRREDILDPYPTVVDPTNPKQFALHPKEKNFKKVEKAMGFVLQELKALPTVLKDRLDSLDQNSFPLLQWVLASNRCHIVKLSPDRQIKSMGTTHQFLLLSAPPAKEAEFRKLKLKNKSIYAFHGSRLENWHSIMRNGLMNASGTKFQLNGAAYGSGIYLSPHASVSFGYSGIHGGHASTADKKKGRPTMLSSQNLNCIALCEVIDSSKIKKSGNIWVLGEADHVVTRFFFVYEDNTTGDTNFDTREDKYIKEIENAVKSLIS
ncbi:Poly polymerase 6 [Oopsacas minuta]|uniref:Poly [ADP-ribose] polymerase n=1 Tax=Oopsacas minuta TaxID=111878 RepID=A0AAV7KAW1_9METZ|nr:Poly polymerase 6 [Oopsacas minuta]